MQQLSAKFSEIQNVFFYNEKKKYLIDNSSNGKYATQSYNQIVSITVP
jgi:hypothetical protein